MSSPVANISETEETTASSAVGRSTIDTNFIELTKSFGKLLLTVLLVYFMGYYHFSMAWIIIALIIYTIREKHRKEKEFRLKIARAAATCEKDSILARVEDLPSWVYFPDTERAEWINKMLLQLWPYLGHFVKDFLLTNVEPTVQETVKNTTKFGSFKFAKIDLGDSAPRVGGIKVYREHVARNEIIMDVELFYAGDCNIEVWVSKLRAGIKDVQLHGTLRVIFKPLITDIPLIGGMQVFFLNSPVLDFNLTNVADVFDLPGLGDMLRKIIGDQLGNIIVLPNKITIKLSDAVSTKTLKFIPPAGVVRIHVISAEDLMKKDIGVLGFGKSDPYGIISVGAQVFKTKVIPNTVNPQWDFYCEAIIDQTEGQNIQVELYDKDQGNEDDFLGRLNIDVQAIAAKGQYEDRIPLEEAKSGRVHLNVQWLGLSSNILDLSEQQKEIENLKEKVLALALLLVYVDSGQHLPGAAKSPIEPCPLVRMTVGSQKQETACQRSTNDPVWEESFTFFVVNPDLQELYVDVIDMKSAKSLGTVVFNISRLLSMDNLEFSQPLHLKNSGPQSKLHLTLQLRILKSGMTVPMDISSEYPDLPDCGRSRCNSEGPNDSTRSSPVRATNPSPSETPLENTVNTVSYAVLDSVDISQVDTLRRRNVEPTLETTHGLGQVQLTLRFSQQRNRLIVVVHRVADLPVYDVNDPPDAYVKMYLQPDKNRDSKRKTQVVKNSCNPTYDETFDYIMSQNDLSGVQLYVTVNNRSSSMFAKSTVIGQVSINLADIDLNKAITNWYHLEPEAG